VLVPRYSEYPSTLAPFQQVPEPSMPYNVSFPHGFNQGQQSPGGSSSPGSPFGIPGMLFIHAYFALYNNA
jgi:hypothetical protein